MSSSEPIELFIENQHCQLDEDKRWSNWIRSNAPTTWRLNVFKFPLNSRLFSLPSVSIFVYFYTYPLPSSVFITFFFLNCLQSFTVNRFKIIEIAIASRRRHWIEQKTSSTLSWNKKASEDLCASVINLGKRNELLTYLLNVLKIYFIKIFYVTAVFIPSLRFFCCLIFVSRFTRRHKDLKLKSN